MLAGLADETCRWLCLSAIPTRSSLSVARRKVPVASLRQVLHELVDHVSGLLPGAMKYFSENRRFIAVDATSLVCPNTPSLLKSLDRPHWSPWLLAHYPRAMVVVAFDVVRRLPLEWVLLEKGTGERAAIEPLLKRFRSGDVVLMDRGYPSRAVLASLVRSGVDVVMPMTAGKAGAWPEVKKFLNSGAKTAVIEYTWEKGKTVAVRLILRNPPAGRPLKHQKREMMIVLTTLLPKHGFEAKDILDLYGKRWDIESLFREMKEAFGIERFQRAPSTASSKRLPQSSCGPLLSR